MSFKAARSEAAERRDAIQETTDRIIAALEAGVKPWVRPWDKDKCSGPQAPVNGATGTAYHGINVLLLAMHPLAFGGDPRWMTYKQADEKGWQVRKGEKSSVVFFYKPLDVKDDEAKDGHKIVPLLRTFNVFHASQVEGIPAYSPPTVEEAPWTRPEATETILKNSGIQVRTGGDRAFYSPDFDFIQLPPDPSFRGVEYWAATAMHEFGHATGHKTRLNRDLTGGFGSAKYAAEEARVEMAAAFVCNTLNLPTDFANHASYISEWLVKLKSDKKEIFHAAADAQRIADYILSHHPDYAIQPVPASPAASTSHTVLAIG